MMKPHEVEAWVLRIADALEKQQRIEDTRVELKAKWVEPVQAARRIAAHANSAGGADILWIIGMDEENGIVGADQNELATWHPTVKAQFDGIDPDLICDLNIPIKRKTIVALLFDTSRLPFVVKNPAHGKKGGGPVSLEVPWREGTSTRTATRSDLIRILSPLHAAPTFEFLGASLAARHNPGGVFWILKLVLYVEIVSNEPVVIPFHRCQVDIKVGDSIKLEKFETLRLEPPPGFDAEGMNVYSQTIVTTTDEAIIHGPGKAILKAKTTIPDFGMIPQMPAWITYSLLPSGSSTPVRSQHEIPFCEREPNKGYFVWQVGSSLETIW